MSDFSDLWQSAGPAKPQQLPLKSLAANNKNTNAVSRPTHDAFNALASAGSSQPNSRPITPSIIKQSTTPKLNAADAFGGLVSFGSSSRDDGLTIAERAAKAERQRTQQAERQRTENADREHAALKSQASFWDQFEGGSKPPAKPKPNGILDFDLLAPTLSSSSQSKAPKAVEINSSAANWDLDFIPSDPIVSVVPPTAKPDLFSIDDLETFAVTQPRHSKEPSRSNTPGSFDFGDREDAHFNANDEEADEDDILGSLAKPVEEVRRMSPRPTPKAPSPTFSGKTKSRTSSPPPHVVGRIVEMGFSVQQAKVALAATDTGLDVDAALEVLLQNASAEQERGRERGEEPETDRRRQQREVAVSSQAPNAAARSAPSQNLQDQADKLLAQASTIGLSVLSKANAMWKEGREKVVKAYEEQRAASGGGDAGRSTGRPRWMDAAVNAEEDSEGTTTRTAGRPRWMDASGDDERFSDVAVNTRAGETRATESSTVPPQTQAPKRDLFADDEPVIYKSPARRRPPVSASTSTSTSAVPSKAPSRSPTPLPPVSRPAIFVSSSALAVSNAQKASGTDHFKLGRFAESEAAYGSALAALPDAHVLRVPLYNNRALTRLRTGDYKGTVEDTGEAVRIITGDLDVMWDPTRETPGEDLGVDLGAALGKALRRRAEAHEGMEKWNHAMGDWERLSAAPWAGQNLRGDAIKGAGRCRRMISASESATPVASRRPAPRKKPAQSSVVAATGPSEAVSRVRDANAAQEAEEQARHDLKDSVDARLAAWRAGKETNLRALIASLDMILWPELGWQKVGMADLVSPGQVKVRYTKAISKLHPDKLNANNTDVEQRMIANGVFGTLNEAWNAFR